MVDGIGGTVKRSVWRRVRSGKAHITNPAEYAEVAKDRWRRVRSGKAHITNPAEYAEVAKDRNPGIYIQFITKDSIDAMNSFFRYKMGR